MDAWWPSSSSTCGICSRFRAPTSATPWNSTSARHTTATRGGAAAVVVVVTMELATMEHVGAATRSMCSQLPPTPLGVQLLLILRISTVTRTAVREKSTCTTPHRRDSHAAASSVRRRRRRRLPPSDSHTRARQGPFPTQNCCGLLWGFATPIPLGPMKRFCTCTKDSESPRIRKRRTPSSCKTAQSGEVKLSSLKPPPRGGL